MNEPRQATQPKNGKSKSAESKPPSRVDEVRTLVKRTMPGAVARLLGKNADVPRFCIMFLNALEAGPADLMRCTDGSLARAMLLAAEVRLEVGRGPYPHAYVIPYFNKDANGGKGGHEAQLQISVWGYVELMRRGGNRKVWADVIYEGDHYKCISGTAGKQIEHEPAWFDSRESRGQVLGSYACALLENGETVVEPVSWEELQTARAQNRGKTPAWDLWPEQMYQKVALKRLAKYLAKGDGTDRLLEIDDNPNTKPVIDVPGVEVPEGDSGGGGEPTAQGPLDRAVAEEKARSGQNLDDLFGARKAANGTSSDASMGDTIDRAKLFAMLVDADERWQNDRARVEKWSEEQCLASYAFLRIVLQTGFGEDGQPPAMPEHMRREAA